MQSPLRALQLAATEIPWFQSMLRDPLPANGGDVEALLCTDEVVPGDVLQPNPARRAYAFYVTLLNFGLLTQHPDSWLSVAVLRTSVAHAARSGLATCAPHLLRAWMPDLTDGVVLNLGENDARWVRLRFHHVQNFTSAP